MNNNKNDFDFEMSSMHEMGPNKMIKLMAVPVSSIRNV